MWLLSSLYMISSTEASASALTAAALSIMIFNWFANWLKNEKIFGSNCNRSVRKFAGNGMFWFQDCAPELYLCTPKIDSILNVKSSMRNLWTRKWMKNCHRFRCRIKIILELQQSHCMAYFLLWQRILQNQFFVKNLHDVRIHLTEIIIGACIQCETICEWFFLDRWRFHRRLTAESRRIGRLLVQLTNGWFVCSFSFLRCRCYLFRW